MTARLAMERSTEYLARAAEIMGRIDLRRVPTAQRPVVEAALAVVESAFEFVRASVPVDLLVAPPLPRQATATQRLGARADAEGQRKAPSGRLVTLEEAAAAIEGGIEEVRLLMATGTLPRFELGHGLVRTRLVVEETAASDEQVDAKTVAAYLSVDRKWVYNHLGELPHWILGSSKAFRISEIDWYLETYRRVLLPYER